MTPPDFLGNEAIRLVALAALAAPFVISAVTKLADLEAADAEMAALRLHPARAVVLAVVAVQLAGSMLLFLPGLDWVGAGVLAGFTMLATLLAHRPGHGVAFWEHVAMAGGLLLVAAMAAR